MASCPAAPSAVARRLLNPIKEPLAAHAATALAAVRHERPQLPALGQRSHELASHAQQRRALRDRVHGVWPNLLWHRCLEVVKAVAVATTRDVLRGVKLHVVGADVALALDALAPDDVFCLDEPKTTMLILVFKSFSYTT